MLWLQHKLIIFYYAAFQWLVPGSVGSLERLLHSMYLTLMRRVRAVFIEWRHKILETSAFETEAGFILQVVMSHSNLFPTFDFSGPLTPTFTDLFASTTDALPDMWIISDFFPHANEAWFWSDSIRFHLPFPCLHVHIKNTWVGKNRDRPYPDFFFTSTNHVCGSVEGVQPLIRRPSECTLVWLRGSEAGDDHVGRLSSISCSHRVSSWRLPVHQGSVAFQILSRAFKVAKGHWEDVNQIFCFYLNTYLKHIYIRFFATRFFSSSSPKCLLVIHGTTQVQKNLLYLTGKGVFFVILFFH